MDPVLFMRAFPQTPQTICTEPVLAWLAAHDITPRVQRHVWGRLGFARGVAAIARRLGLRLELPRDVKAGEPIVFRANGLALCGLAAESGFCVAGASRKIIIVKGDVLRVARPCRS